MTQVLAGLSIGLLLSASWAQAQICDAKVSKGTITLNESEESGQEVKNVSGVFVRECTRRKPGL